MRCSRSPALALPLGELSPKVTERVLVGAFEWGLSNDKDATSSVG